MAFKIIRNDITRVKADVIVNSANEKPICAGYRTDAAIYEAAGYEDLLVARKEIGELQVGKVAATPAFKLNAKFIIHTVGPLWKGGTSGEPDYLRSCYRESLIKAIELKAKSIAFPLISTGALNYPKKQALDIATEIFREFTSEHKLNIILVVYDNESFELSTDLTDFVESYIDEHYVGKQALIVLKQSKTPPTLKQEHWTEENNIRGKACYIKRNKPKAANEESQINLCLSNIDEPSPLPLAKFRVKNVKRIGLAESLENDIENKLESFEIQTFGQRLARYLFEKKLDSSTVYNSIFMDRKHFSKILSDKIKQPKRETVLALAIGMKMNIQETKDLLSYAGYAFTPYNMTDVIVSAFIERNIYDIWRINLALSKRNLTQLG